MGVRFYPHQSSEKNMSMPSVPLCWWCEAVANSREHKFKKSDVARASKSWAHNDKPVYFSADSRVTKIMGPNSNLVKFARVICEPCNNTKSQPFDRAYDTFGTWVRARGEALMGEDSLDWTAIYGPRPEEHVLNLLKYFVKHMACRAAESKAAIPSEYVAMLDQARLPNFELTLTRNRETSGLPGLQRAGLHNFPFLAVYSTSQRTSKPPFQYGCTVGFLDVIYRYRAPNRFAWEGETVDPARPSVRLGFYRAGDPHPGDEGQLYGFGGNRTVTIGEHAFDVPVLSPAEIHAVIDAGIPNADMSVEERIDARVRAVHAMLSPYYEEVTMDFLEDNLTMDAANELWRIATGQTT
jgi:hypothetical protein